jgi:hypothetical protein
MNSDKTLIKCKTQIYEYAHSQPQINAFYSVFVWTDSIIDN